MRSKQIFSMAWANMKQRKLRTSLTTLGVVIGITAVISLASLGEGFRVTVTNQMEQGFELNVLTVIPGSLFGGLTRGRFQDQQIQKIANFSEVDIATGVMQIGNVTLKKDGREVQAFVATGVNFGEFIGVYPDRFDFDTVQGSPAEWKNNSIVIGYKVNHPNETEPVFASAGDVVNMTYTRTAFPIRQDETRNFTVVGTLLKKGTPGITNFDYWIFIPLDTAREIFKNPESGPESDLIFVKVFDAETSEHVGDEIEALFPPY